MFERFAILWCKTMHSRAMWPIHGYYVCPDCLRRYAVAWRLPAEGEYADPALRDAGIPSAEQPEKSAFAYRV
jgi:hypothetical protein